MYFFNNYYTWFILIDVYKYLLNLSTGPAPPNAPSQVSVISVSHEDAEIEWRVLIISFTPESYHVEYGLSPQSLNLTSDTTTGTLDIQATDSIYSSTITQLQEHSIYYYQIVAINSIGTARSGVKYFTTTLPCK